MADENRGKLAPLVEPLTVREEVLSLIVQQQTKC